MQRRGSYAGDDPVAFRPQPSADGLVLKRQIATSQSMHVRIERSIPTLKFVSRHGTISNGLTTDKDLPHDRILVAAPDKPAKLYSSRPLLALSLLEYRFGEA